MCCDGNTCRVLHSVCASVGDLMAQMQCGAVLELTHICTYKSMSVFSFKTLILFTKYSVYKKRCTIILELVYYCTRPSLLVY